MLEPEQVNPVDVLHHLNALGFQDVTPHQLDDFLHDLKKLIRYEQKRSRCDPKKTEDHHSDCRHGCGSCRRRCCCCSGCDSGRSSETTIASDEYSYSCSLASNSSLNSCKVEEEKPESIKTDLQPSENAKSLNVHSSFIRPWNLPPNKEKSFRSRKNLDPVSLYHHYKEIWKQNKIPGESNHSQLRWNIRNKMLGQEPQLRITASNLQSLK